MNKGLEYNIIMIISILILGGSIFPVISSNSPSRNQTLNLDDTMVQILPSNLEITSQETFTLEVYCIPGQAIKAYEFAVSFNQTLLKANSITEGDIFDGYNTFFNAGIIDNTDGTITELFNFIMEPGNVSNSGSFVTISFTSKNISGTTSINLSEVGVTNETNYVPIHVNNGIVQIDANGTNHPPFTPYNPDPTDEENNVDIHCNLSWTGDDPDSGNIVTYDIYFGTSLSPPIVKNNQSSTSYNPGELSYSTDYYWRITSWDNHGASTRGPLWSFTTKDFVNHPPAAPTNPIPENNAGDVDVEADLSWYCNDPDDDPLTYNIYFGKNSNPPQLAENHSFSHYFLYELDYSETYYWKIVSYDSYGLSNQSPLWSFTTSSSPNNPPQTPINPTGEILIKCNTTQNYTTSSTDPDNDQLYYIWSWGDETDIETYGPYSSEETCIASHQWKHPGDYQVKVKARDTHYKESLWSEPLTITAIGIPKVTINGPSYGLEHVPLQFNGSVNGGIAPYTWYWEFESDSTSTEQNPVYTFNEPGDYSIKLTVLDKEGQQASAIAICHIAKTGDLNVIIDTSHQGHVYEQIEFSGIVNHGTPPYQWQWNFGDGTNSTQQHITHMYTKKGIYNVTLSVEDQTGLQGNDSLIIDINDNKEDLNPPTFEVIKPIMNSFYLNDNKFLFWIGIFVIGDLTIEIEGDDDASGIDYVEFFVNDNMVSTDYLYPYQWKWNEQNRIWNTIHVKVYDRTGKYSEKDMPIWRFF